MPHNLPHRRLQEESTKPLKWSEFLAIFVAAFITAVAINLMLGGYSQAEMTQTEPQVAPVIVPPTTMMIRNMIQFGP